YQRRLSGKSGRDTESLGNRRLWLHTDDAVNQFAVFEDQHGRYARDLKTRSGLRIVVDVQFRDAIVSLRLSGELVHNRSNNAAWTTPRRPTVNPHGLPARRQNFAFKGLIRNY